MTKIPYSTMCIARWRLLLAVAGIAGRTNAFLASRRSATAPFSNSMSPATILDATKPQRLDDNVDGVLYVNDRCINCAACAGFAPQTFQRETGHHVVHTQPREEYELAQARAALAACPVAAIRIETKAERRHRATTPDAKQAVDEAWSDLDESTLLGMRRKGDATKGDTKAESPASPFPRPFLQTEGLAVNPAIPNVYWTGHHHEASFGAIPYLVRARNGGSSGNANAWIMVDTPRYSTAAAARIASITGPSGPDFLFMTHVDDTADHGKWAEHFSSMKEIFHEGDLGRHNWIGDATLENADVLLKNPSASDSSDAKAGELTAYSLDGTMLTSDWRNNFEAGLADSDAVVLHTPGHSPGSCTLYVRRTDEHPGIIFTGDTYGSTEQVPTARVQASSSESKRRRIMTGFGRYGNDAALQAESLDRLLHLDWEIVAPGHGLARDYRAEPHLRDSELRTAQHDLKRAR